MTEHNGFKIAIPDDYFARSAAKDYADDAGLALVREFAQNSCDAKAKTVEFVFRAGNELVVSDDGKGADAKTIRERILTPLATYKDEGSIGGFGKAKELLFFANEKWKIRTRDCEVVGSYLDVLSFKTGLEHSEGFLVVVTLPEGLYRAARDNARLFMEYSERPGVTWMLDGDAVMTTVRRPKRCSKDFQFAKGYVAPYEDGERHTPYVYIRTGGLFTSKKYGHHPREVGRVIIEVQGSSVDLLTPARDDFRSSEHRCTLDNWLYDLSTDYKRTLAEEIGDEVVFFDDEFIEPAGGYVRAVLPETNGVTADVSFLRGEESVPTEEQAVRMLNALGEALKEAANDNASENGNQSEKVMTTAKSAPKEEKKFDMTLLPKLEGVKRLTVHTGGKTYAKKAAAWLKKNQTTAATVLAGWTTAVRAVCKSAGLQTDAVGFCFHEGVEAEFVRANNGRFGLLINPMKFDLNNYHKPDEMFDLAIHEVAHQVGGNNHDETWANNEMVLRRKCRAPGVRGCIARSLLTGEVENHED